MWCLSWNYIWRLCFFNKFIKFFLFLFPFIDFQNLIYPSRIKMIQNINWCFVFFLNIHCIHRFFLSIFFFKPSFNMHVLSLISFTPFNYLRFNLKMHIKLKDALTHPLKNLFKKLNARRFCNRSHIIAQQDKMLGKRLH